MNRDTGRVSRGTYANGSFGLHKQTNPRGDGNLITVYFCGLADRQSPAQMEIPCAHLTRGEARECLRARKAMARAAAKRAAKAEVAR